MKTKIFLLSFIFYLSFFVFSLPACANSFSLSIYPPLAEIIIKPGLTATQSFVVQNHGSADVKLIPQILPFQPTNVEGNISLITDKQYFDRSINWFSLANKKINTPFLLKAGEKQELIMKLTLPADSPEKDLYYALTVKQQPQTATKGQTRTKIHALIGTNVLISIKKQFETKTDLVINNFNLTNKSFFPSIIDSFEDISFTAALENKTKHFTKTKGSLTITDSRGKNIQSYKLLEKNILAYSQRNISCLQNPDCPLIKKPFIGKIKATLSTESDTQTITFWILPIKLTAACCILLITAILAVKINLKVRQSPQENKKKKKK